MGDYAEPKRQATATSATPKPQPAPKPKISTASIRFNREAMDFAGVVGRSTLGQVVSIHHEDSRQLVFDAKIRGPNFSIEGDASGVLPSDSKNERPAPIAVRYMPTSAGAHRAALAVSVRPGFANGLSDTTKPVEAEEAIELNGFATDLAPDHTARSGPVPVVDLPNAAPTHDRSLQRAHTLAAIDAVSSLARTFDSVVAPGDQAVEHFKRSIREADADLNRRILEFVNDEGRAETSRSNSIEHLGGLRAFLLKSGEVSAEQIAHHGSIPIAMAALALEWVFEAKDASDNHREGGARVAEYNEQMNGVMDHAGPAIAGATSGMLKRYGKLVEGYATSRERLAAIAGGEGDKALRELQHVENPNELQHVYDQARDKVERFKRELETWGHEVRQLAAAGIQANTVADAAYAKLLERYLEFRATGGELDGRAEEKRSLTLIGYLDLGAPDIERPMNIQLNGFQFGDYKEMSPTMRGFVESKRLDELDTWDVRIRLEGTNQDGSTGIVRVAGGKPLFAWNYDMVGYKASIMGVEKLWSLLTKGTLAEHLIWVRS